MVKKTFSKMKFIAFSAVVLSLILLVVIMNGKLDTNVNAAVAGPPNLSWYDGVSETYELYTAEDLAGLAQLVNLGTQDFNGKTIVLGADIDLSGYDDSTNGGGGWIAIGTGSTRAFRGTFDGNGFIISGLYASRAAVATRTDRVGLFGYLYGATIKNVILTDVEITGYDYVGGITGDLNGGSITNCHVQGTIHGHQRVAGIVASTQAGASIVDCSFDGTIGGISAASDMMGGIVGFFFNSNIVRCYTSGSINARDRLGGIAGYCSSGAAAVYITDCYSTMDITGNNYIGGIAGSVNLSQTPASSPAPLDNTNFVLTRTYSTGYIKGNNYVGGLVGWLKGVVQSSAALNICVESVNPNVGRVAGYIDLASTLTNNKAFLGMENGSGIAFGGENTINGESIDATTINLDGTIGNLFMLNGTPWYGESGKLPTFEEGGTNMPAHLLVINIDESMFDAISNVVFNGHAHTPNIVLSGVDPNVTFSVTYQNNVNASNTARAIISGNGNYGGIVTLYFEIEKALATPNIPSNITAVYEDTLGDVSFPYDSTGTWSWVEELSTLVGSVGVNTFWALYEPNNNNYSSVVVDVDINVARKTIEKPIVVNNIVFTGGLQDGVVYDTSLNAPYVLTAGVISAINVGNYLTSFSFVSGNYKWDDDTIGTLTLSWTIGNAIGIAVMDMSGMISLVYDGTPKGIPAVSITSGDWLKVEYEYANVEVVDASTVWTKTVPINAGEHYYIRAILTNSPNGNFSDYVTAEEMYTISKADGKLDPMFKIPTGIVGSFFDASATGINSAMLSSINLYQYTGSYVLWDFGIGDQTTRNAYKNATSLGNAGVNSFPATYTPTNPNYDIVDDVMLDVIVPKLVVPAAYTPITAYGGMHGSFVYDGSEKFGVANATGVHYILVAGDISEFGQGNYFADFALKHPSNYMWADGTSTNRIVYWSIGEAEGYAQVEMDNFEYDGVNTGDPKIVNHNILDMDDYWTNIVFEYRVGGAWVLTAPVNAGSYQVRAILSESPSGNYTAVVTDAVSYTIYRKILTDELEEVSGSYIYNGTAHKPTPVVNGLSVSDYIISYANNINAGEASLTITGIGNYVGSLTVHFTIEPKDLTISMFKPIGNVIYNGEFHYPSVEPSYLEPYVTIDLSNIEYTDNKNVGIASVTVFGVGNYKNSVTLMFEIEKSSSLIPDVPGLSATFGDTLFDVLLPSEWEWKDLLTTSVGNVGDRQFIAIYTPEDDNYDPIEISLTINVLPLLVEKPTIIPGLIFDSSLLVGINYDSSSPAYYLLSGDVDGITAQTYTAVFSLSSPNYLWEDGSDVDLTLNWTIGIAKGLAEIQMENFEYLNNKLPLIEFLDGDWEVIIIEYSLDEVNWTIHPFTNVGIYWVRARLTNSASESYADYITIPKEYKITPKVLTDQLLHTPGTYVYNSLPHTPIANTPGLVSGVDYIVSYTNNINAGNANLTITGKGNYSGTLSDTFVILPKNITLGMFNSVGNVTYTGSPFTPYVGLSGVDMGVTYSCVYDDNTNAGIASITVTGFGNYMGVEVINFTINKAIPYYVLPMGLTAMYGDTLEDVSLSMFTGWEWFNSLDTKVGNAGLNMFLGVFTPLDEDNYQIVMLPLEIMVGRAPIARPTAINDLRWNNLLQIGVNYVGGSSAYSLVDGSISEIENGTYQAVFSLNSNYIWDNGSLSLLVVSWEIKAAIGFAEVEIDNYIYGDTLKGSPTFVWATMIGDWVDGRFEYSTNNTTWSLVAPSNVGTYFIRGVLDNSSSTHYENYITASVMYTISAMTILKTMFNDINDCEYDTFAHEPVVSLLATYVGITFDVQYLNNTNAGVASVIISGKGNYTGVVSLTFTIEKATPSYIKPATLNAVYGNTLGNVILDSAWKWVDILSTSVGSVGLNQFDAIYTPLDVNNYKTVVVKLDINVSKASVKMPSVINNLVYNGLELIGVNYDELFIAYNIKAGVAKAINSGGYTVTFELNPNYKWDNNSEVDLTLNWNIGKAISYIPYAFGGLVFNGEEQTGVGYSEAFNTYKIKSGVTKATNSGDYTVTFELDSNYMWVDGSEEDITINWKIAKAIIEMPYAITGLIWDGEEQIGVICENEGSAYKLVDGSISEINSGPYSATFELNPNYTWGGRFVDNDTLVVYWVISKVNGFGEVDIDNYIFGGKVEDNIKTNLDTLVGDWKLLVIEFSVDGKNWENSPAVNVGTYYYRAIFSDSESGNFEVYISSPKMYMIMPIMINIDMFNSINNVTYNGSSLTPSVSLKPEYSSITYNLVYSSNVNAGVGSILVTGSGNYGGIVVLNFNINKANPTYNVPNNLTAIYNQTLGNVSLGSGWTWKEVLSTSVGNAGVNKFEAIYTPVDTNNYLTVSLMVDIVVSKALVSKPTVITDIIWNGEVQTGINYILGTNAYTLTGEALGVDIGKYTATFTLNPNYMWDDDTTESLVLEWEILTPSPSTSLVWLWFIIGMLIGSTIVFILWFLYFKDRDEDEEEEEKKKPENVEGGTV